MQIPFSAKELETRISLNRKRLLEPYYQIDEVFMPEGYDWQGDKEGRALLAFCCHAKMGNEIPTMRQMMSLLRKKTNEFLFFGEKRNEIISEQQFSGHSWYLRGLCAYYRLTGEKLALEAITSTVRNLYLPAKGRFSSYPTSKREEGGVSGSSLAENGGFLLSSDVGCVFMSIDGLSDAYEITRDPETLALLDEMISVFLAIDKEEIRAQTHCTLTAARGMVRLCGITGEKKYLDGAEEIAALYLKSGMTLTYQNLNWWGKPESWTEPCAIVDSLILFHQLFGLTGRQDYRTVAVRIAHNGLASAQRSNGGAGTDTVVLPNQPLLRADMEEAPFCCSMRLAEGLLYLSEHRSDFTAEVHGELSRDSAGRITDGDLIYVPLDEETEPYADRGKILMYQGNEYAPLLKYYLIPMDKMKQITQRILF